MFGKKEKKPRKTNPIFYIVAGAYLIYLAYEIFVNEMGGDFANLTVKYALSCVALIAMGVGLIVWTMRRMYQAEIDAFEERGRRYQEEAAREEGGEELPPPEEDAREGSDN